MNQPAAATASNAELFDSLERHWQRCSNVQPRGSKPHG
jgi:hypothetical protein